MGSEHGWEWMSRTNGKPVGMVLVGILRLLRMGMRLSYGCVKPSRSIAGILRLSDSGRGGFWGSGNMGSLKMRGIDFSGTKKSPCNEGLEVTVWWLKFSNFDFVGVVAFVCTVDSLDCLFSFLVGLEFDQLWCDCVFVWVAVQDCNECSECHWFSSQGYCSGLYPSFLSSSIMRPCSAAARSLI